MTFQELEAKLQQATLDPKAAIEVAGELAINHLGKLHEKCDILRVEVAQEKIKIREANPKMSIAEIEVRIEATPLFLDYLKAKHAVERTEEYIRIAKTHASIANGF